MLTVLPIIPACLHNSYSAYYSNMLNMPLLKGVSPNLDPLLMSHVQLGQLISTIILNDMASIPTHPLN